MEGSEGGQTPSLKDWMFSRKLLSLNLQLL